MHSRRAQAATYSGLLPVIPHKRPMDPTELGRRCHGLPTEQMPHAGVIHKKKDGNSNMDWSFLRY